MSSGAVGGKHGSKRDLSKETYHRSKRDLQERRPHGAHHSHRTYLGTERNEPPTTVGSEKRKRGDIYIAWFTVSRKKSPTDHGRKREKKERGQERGQKKEAVPTTVASESSRRSS